MADMGGRELDILCREIHDTMSDEAKLKVFLSCLSSARTSPENADMVLRSGCFELGDSYGTPDYRTPSFAEVYSTLFDPGQEALRGFYLDHLRKAEMDLPELKNQFPNALS